MTGPSSVSDQWTLFFPGRREAEVRFIQLRSGDRSDTAGEDVDTANVTGLFRCAGHAGRKEPAMEDDELVPVYKFVQEWDIL